MFLNADVVHDLFCLFFPPTLLSLSPQPGIRMLRDRLFHAQTEAVQNRGGGSTSKTPNAAQIAAPKAQIMVSAFFFF